VRTQCKCLVSIFCIPRNETVQPRYFQNRIITFCLPISTFMYLWAIYIFPGSVCLFCCSQKGRQILGKYKSPTDTCVGIGNKATQFHFLGIQKLDFRYSVDILKICCHLPADRLSVSPVLLSDPLLVCEHEKGDKQKLTAPQAMGVKWSILT
jgi:hypothetical protein